MSTSFYAKSKWTLYLLCLICFGKVHLGCVENEASVYLNSSQSGDNNITETFNIAMDVKKYFDKKSSNVFFFFFLEIKLQDYISFDRQISS